MYYCKIEGPLGQMIAASGSCAGQSEDSPPGLCGLWFQGQKYFPADFSGWTSKPGYGPFPALREWLASYFAGKNPPFEKCGKAYFALSPEGTAFRKSVWKELQKIPYGKTASYGEIAAKLGKKGSGWHARSVGGAVGHNPISIIIPCHRIVGADGSLTGYAGGLDRKRALLELEGALGIRS
jgi:methylated-DNA-[protein]-cysteine S-methyltransferase